MIGSHSSSLGGGHRDESSRIYLISSDKTLSSSLEQGGGQRTTTTTASQSLEMMTTASTSSPSRKVPTISSRQTEHDFRGCQLPGATIEADYLLGQQPQPPPPQPVIIKQEYEGASDSDSRTSVFSDMLPCGLTRFHFSLCFGMIGFVVFWVGLLLRIYLPH